jgi:hypothetical protein
VKETMNSIDELLKKVISEDRIYTSRLVAHLEWNRMFKHLIVATSILEKRYILLDEHDDIDLTSISNNLYFYEVIKEAENDELYKGVSNHIYETDWLGEFLFILTTKQFDSKNARRLIEKNYHQLIYLQNKSIEKVEPLQMDLRIVMNHENSKWGFCWVNHHHPFYMEEVFLCPRKNCVTEGLGIIWCTEKEAEMIMKYITLVTRKFRGEKSHFKRYPTVHDFREDFLSNMKQIVDNTIKPADLDGWSMKVLAGYSVA